jgi:hypothetical protein
MDRQQLERFRAALQRKARVAAEKARARTPRPTPPTKAPKVMGDPDGELDEIARERTPDDPDPRVKSTRHGQVTADKWNQ